MHFTITECRCTRKTFAELLALAENARLDAPGLQKATGAGQMCKHCRPWLLQCLATGRTSFTEDSDTLRNGAVLLQHFHPDWRD